MSTVVELDEEKERETTSRDLHSHTWMPYKRCAMVISVEDAIGILNKWKDESVDIFVVGESPFRKYARGIEGRGIRWATSQHVKVSQVSLFRDTEGLKTWTVEFEGAAGTLALYMGQCRIFYQDVREAPPDIKEEAAASTVSSLDFLYRDGGGFQFFELRE